MTKPHDLSKPKDASRPALVSELEVTWITFAMAKEMLAAPAGWYLTHLESSKCGLLGPPKQILPTAFPSGTFLAWQGSCPHLVVPSVKPLNG